MSSRIFDQLNNPAWYALSETHQEFAVGNDQIKRYQFAIAPFAATLSLERTTIAQLDHWGYQEDPFYFIGDLPELPATFRLESSLICVQMVARHCSVVPDGPPIEKLGEADQGAMISLVNLVLPGYFKPGTRLMGDYIGIKDEGRLVAMTGERLRMNAFTEISAVITHPSYTRRGYATRLVANITKKNLDQGVLPFLHTAETNKTAIKIYEQLGYERRRLIVFWKISRG